MQGPGRIAWQARCVGVQLDDHAMPGLVQEPRGNEPVATVVARAGVDQSLPRMRCQGQREPRDGRAGAQHQGVGRAHCLCSGFDSARRSAVVQ